MRKSELKDFWQEHTTLLRVLIVPLMVVLPIYVTYVLWCDEWDKIISGYSELYDVLVNGVGE